MSTPATTRLLAGSFYSALNARQGQEMSFDALKALDWRLLVAAQAQFSPSAFLLDNAIPVAEPIRPTASSSDPYLPSDFNVALAAGKLPSWALSVPLLLTTVADEFASTDGQLNPAPVPAPYFEIELAQFIGETTKVDAILHSSAYALGTGEDAVRDALNKVPKDASVFHRTQLADLKLALMAARHRGLLDVRHPGGRIALGEPRRQGLCRRVSARCRLSGQCRDRLLLGRQGLSSR